LANVANQHALAGSGRVGILSPYPGIVKEIKTTLADLRATGVPVNVLVGRSIALTIIQNKKPDLLEKFTCSEVSFLNSTLTGRRYITYIAELHARIF
jgi:hypothetical protein